MSTQNTTVVDIDENTSDEQLRTLLKGGDVEPAAAAVDPKPAEGKAPSSTQGDEPGGEKPAAGSDPASQPEPTEEEEFEKLPKGIKKRFRKMTEKIRALEQGQPKPAAAAEEKPGAASPKPSSVEEPKEPVMPELETFQGTYAEYQAALKKYFGDLTDYKLSAAEKTRDQKAHQQTVAEQQRGQAKAWNDAEVELMKDPEFKDYTEVADGVQLPGDSPASPVIAQAIQSSPAGVKLLYHLGKNPAEVTRLAGLPPIQAVLELGKIEASLAAKPAAAAPAKAEKKPLPKPPAIPAAGAKEAEIDLNAPDLDQDVFNREVRRLLNH